MPRQPKQPTAPKGMNFDHLPSVQDAKSATDAGYPDVKGRDYLKRTDGWTNFFTGVGKAGVDRRLATKVAPAQVLPEKQLRSMYRGDGLAKKLIEKPSRAMTRGGFTVQGDEKNMVRARLQETGIFKARRNMVRWAKLYGGALGIVGADDGQKYEFPLNETRIRNVHYLHVFNRWRVTFTTGDLYKDTAHPKYGQPEFYRVSPIQGTPFKVHETRTIRLDGAPVDDLALWQNNGWGDSALMAPFEALRQVGAVFGSSESIIEDFVQATIGMKGLSDMIGRGNEDKAIKRLEILDKSRHVLNALLIDADLETYTKVASSVAGLPDLLDRHLNRLAAEANIPVTVLMGESPAGLNATGDSDVRNWYDNVADERDEDLYPVDHQLARLVFLSKDYVFKGKEPENWDIVYPPLWMPTAKEQAEIDKVRSDEVVELIDRNVIDPNEVRKLSEWKDRFALEGDLEPPDDPAADILAEETAAGPGAPPLDEQSAAADQPTGRTPAALKKGTKKKGAAGDAR